MADQPGNAVVIDGPQCSLVIAGRAHQTVAVLYDWQIADVAPDGTFTLTAARSVLDPGFGRLPPFLRPPLEVHIPWGARKLVAPVTCVSEVQFRGTARPTVVPR